MAFSNSIAVLDPVDGAPVTRSALSRRSGPSVGPDVAVVLQVGLLGVLSATAGVGPAGWVAGLGFAVVLRVLLVEGLRRSGRRALGPANRVTLGRAVLVGGVTALAVDSLTRTVPVPVVVTLTGVALLLDGVDGQVARRTGTTSSLGARFDMEVDAFLLLVLCLLLVQPVGVWVLAIGAMRYAFIAAGRLLPWMTEALPPRFSRKVVAVVQGVALVVAVADVLPAAAAVAALATALASLCWSFGRDVIWLARRSLVLRPLVLRPLVLRPLVLRPLVLRPLVQGAPVRLPLGRATSPG